MSMLRTQFKISISLLTFFLFYQMAVDQAQRQNFSSLFLSGGTAESVNPCLILIVRRENVVGDTMEVLRKSKNVDYKKPLKVIISFYLQLPQVQLFNQDMFSVKFLHLWVIPKIFFIKILNQNFFITCLNHNRSLLRSNRLLVCPCNFLRLCEFQPWYLQK